MLNRMTYFNNKIDKIIITFRIVKKKHKYSFSVRLSILLEFCKEPNLFCSCSLARLRPREIRGTAGDRRDNRSEQRETWAD